MISICLFITESQRKWVNTISSIWHPDPSRRLRLLLNMRLSLLRWILKRRIWKKNYCLNPNLLPCGPICGILLFIQKYLLFTIIFKEFLDCCMAWESFVIILRRMAIRCCSWCWLCSVWVLRWYSPTLNRYGLRASAWVQFCSSYKSNWIWMTLTERCLSLLWVPVRSLPMYNLVLLLMD